MLGSIAKTAALLLPIAAASVAPAPVAPHPGDAHAITRVADTSQRSGEASSGSSHDSDALVERVIAVHNGGMELEYDLPDDTKPEERAQTWQFPARVFRPFGGRLRLLDPERLQARRDAWLKRAKISPAMCGRAIFTWTVIRIECDPQSVTKTIEAFGIDPDTPRDGALLTDPHAKGATPLRRIASGPHGATFAVTMVVDPDSVRRDRAEVDLVVAGITGKTVTLAEAQRKWASATVSGTMTITFETDAAGRAWRRTHVTHLTIGERDQPVEDRTGTVITERRLLRRGPRA